MGRLALLLPNVQQEEFARVGFVHHVAFKRMFDKIDELRTYLYFINFF